MKRVRWVVLYLACEIWNEWVTNMASDIMLSFCFLLFIWTKSGIKVSALGLFQIRRFSPLFKADLDISDSLCNFNACRIIFLFGMLLVSSKLTLSVLLLAWRYCLHASSCLCWSPFICFLHQIIDFLHQIIYFLHCTIFCIQFCIRSVNFCSALIPHTVLDQIVNFVSCTIFFPCFVSTLYVLHYLLHCIVFRIHYVFFPALQGYIIIFS